MTTTSTIPPKLRAAVYERDEYRCVRCGEGLRDGHRSIQHRVPGGMGGRRNPNRMSILIAVCGIPVLQPGCHGEIESFRALAKDHGYLVPSGMDPEWWPVLYHGIEWRLLTDAHGWQPLDVGGDAA